MFRVIIRNAVSNWVGFLVQAVSAFLLTPFVLATLGASEYGVWTLVVGLTGYYGLLDLGFRAGLTQYMTRHLARGDIRQVNSTASTGVLVLAACGGLILLASLVLATAAPLLFHLPEGTERDVWWAIIINGGAIALQFPLFPYSALFAATQRYDLSNLIGVLTRLVTALATFLSLRAGHGLIGLSLVVAGGNLLDYGLRWRVAYWILPELRVAVRLANLKSCWEFVHFGLWNVVISGSSRLLLYSGEILIGLFLPAEAIAPYAIAASLINYFTNLFVPIGTVFFPVATELDAQNKTEGLRSVYLFGSKMLLMLALPLGLLSGFWAEDFFRLWLGEGTNGAVPTTAANLFRLLLVAAALSASQRVSYQVLLGMRRVRALAVLFGCEALASTVLTICFLPWLGVYGVAVGSLLPAVVFQGYLYPHVAGRMLTLPHWSYVRAVWLKPLAVGILLASILTAIRFSQPVSSWLHLVLQGSLGGGAAVLLIAILGLNADQREQFLARPLTRMLGWAKLSWGRGLLLSINSESGEKIELPLEVTGGAETSCNGSVSQGGRKPVHF
ncbi:MAG TPA: oligosaccharide flippase family protein [Gemmataceae bacterium]|nr:oligosaccharide flippase family protein [Gemmataceae bacterium]